MSAKVYHWCHLQNGNKHTCGYIEARGAKVGLKVEMIDLDGEYWEVTRVGDPVDKSYVTDHKSRVKSFSAQEYTKRVERRVAA